MIISIELLTNDSLYLQHHLNEVAPKAIKIVIISHSSMLTAGQALNCGADAYLVKPINPEELLKILREKIGARLIKDTNKNMGRETKWLNTPSPIGSKFVDFHEYLENMAKELVAFGLTTNQAKVYTTIVAVELASVSDIAKTSGIRREEVYRLLSTLEKIGIVTKKIGNPRRFLAVPPENAIPFLSKLKLTKVSEEINNLAEKRDMLITKFKKPKISPFEETKSVQSISNAEILFERFVRSNEKAENHIDSILPIEFLQYVQVNMGYMFEEFCARGVRYRIITDESAPTNNSGWFVEMIKDNYFLKIQLMQVISLRFMNKLPFNAVIIDGKEAIWGKFNFKDDECNLWTNNSFQIEIITDAFEYLWKDAKPLAEISAGGKTGTVVKERTAEVSFNANQK